MLHLERIDKAYEKVVTWFLVIAVLSMLFMTLMNIGLRYFGETVEWVEPFVRHLVFFSIFLGATIATGESKHIKIDIVSRLLESKKRYKIQKSLFVIINLLTILGLILLIKSSYSFFLMEKEYGSPDFWGLHSSLLVFIIPLGFSLILLRTVFQTMLKLLRNNK